MKNILVPVDFSAVSKNALEFAIKIAQSFKSKITLFHAVQPSFITSDMGGFIYPESEKEEMLKLFEKMDQLIGFINAHNITADKIIRKGLLSGDDIADLVETEKVDLIITGTHGAKGLEAFFLSTNSVTISEKVKCPVLIVPLTASYHHIKKIMYATDFQYEDLHEIDKISKLASLCNAQIIVTHINNDPKKFIEEENNMNWFAVIGSSILSYENIIYKLIYNENVIDAIEDAITDLDVDILCMSTVEKKFFKKMVSKNSVKKMAFNSKIPLVSLHLSKDDRLVL
ncbi:MAG TPA: universal stress protein [Cytophagaceae bacterium]|nr:universal stress protein [Cytophagaceae bacterium]